MIPKDFIRILNLDLTSDRLLLRPLEESDVDLGLEILTDPEVMRYVGAPRSHEQVIQEMEVSIKRAGGGCIGIWCVIDRATQEKLGTALLLPMPVELADTDWSLVEGASLPDAEIELGYLFKRSAWGRGYATEAARRLLRFAFEDSPLEEVVAVTHRDHTGSQHVLAKAGMTYEGLRRAYQTECSGFRMTRARWRAAEAGPS